MNEQISKLEIEHVDITVDGADNSGVPNATIVDVIIRPHQCDDKG